MTQRDKEITREIERDNNSAAAASAAARLDKHEGRTRESKA